jgi:uncharacterized Zn-finger protein
MCNLMSQTPSFEQPETVFVDDHKVSCDGGNGALGHPLVWYEMGKDDVIECKYCDRRFVRKGGAHDPDA